MTEAVKITRDSLRTPRAAMELSAAAERLSSAASWATVVVAMDQIPCVLLLACYYFGYRIRS